jgi:hypothetical protein
MLPSETGNVSSNTVALVKLRREVIEPLQRAGKPPAALSYSTLVLRANMD